MEQNYDAFLEKKEDLGFGPKKGIIINDSSNEEYLANTPIQSPYFFYSIILIQKIKWIEYNKIK